MGGELPRLCRFLAVRDAALERDQSLRRLSLLDPWFVAAAENRLNHLPFCRGLPAEATPVKISFEYPPVAVLAEV